VNLESSAEHLEKNLTLQAILGSYQQFLHFAFFHYYTPKSLILIIREKQINTLFDKVFRNHKFEGQIFKLREK
jgi:hypothetical protein